MDKYALGWSEVWDHHLENFPQSSFVKIVARHKNVYRAIAIDGSSLNCYLPGRMVHEATLSATLPAVGDWCTIGDIYLDESNERAATVEKVLDRCSSITRLAAGTETDTQVLAANIDFVFIVTSMNKDFSIERLRRYIFMCDSSQVSPIILLSKADLMESELESEPADPDSGTYQQAQEIEQLVSKSFPDVPYIKASVITHAGIQEIQNLLGVGKTAVFVGSSGVGKSTLVNYLLSTALQKVQQVRTKDDAGRHTTSSAGLFFLPNGGMIIDTPGLRELQLYGTDIQLARAVPAVSTFASQCKFRDCSHTGEPDCAVETALIDGELSDSEFASYRKLEREVAYSARRLDERLASAERKKWKKITIDNRRRYKHRAD